MEEFKETLTLEQLAEWSKGRWAAGQHQAALDVQKRYEALVREKNPDRLVEFVRDEKTGELTHVAESDEALLARLEREEAEAKAKAEAVRKPKGGKEQ